MHRGNGSGSPYGPKLSLEGGAEQIRSDREITLGPNNKRHMKGAEYLNHFVLPNFYFHLTAAYAVIRHFGADIRKRDFLGSIPIQLS